MLNMSPGINFNFRWPSSRACCNYLGCFASRNDFIEQGVSGMGCILGQR